MKRKFTNWEFINYSNQINKDIEIIGEYKNFKTNILCRCKLCGKEFECSPQRILNMDHNGLRRLVRNKKLCPNSDCIEHDKYISAKIERTLSLISKIQEAALGKYILLGHFISDSSLIKCRCLLCNYEWEDIPMNLSKAKYKCPKCSNKGTNSIYRLESQNSNHKKRDIRKQTEEKSQGIQLFDVNETDDGCFSVVYRKCGHSFTTNSIDHIPNSCVECRRTKRNATYEELSSNGFTAIKIPQKDLRHVQRSLRIMKGEKLPEDDDYKSGYYSKDEFRNIVKKLTPNIEVVDEEIYPSKKILCRCKSCGSVWGVWASYLLRGTACPKCRGSIGENIILSYLEENNYQFIREYSFPNCKNIRQLRFDFYLPEYNAVIEFDGIQHFVPTRFCSNYSENDTFIEFRSIQKRDRIKNSFCKKNNIPMLRIKYNEADIRGNIESFIGKLKK